MLDDPRVELLERCPPFVSFDPEELAALAAEARTEHYDAEEVICREGEPGDALFLIVSGSVRVAQTTEKGLEQAITLLGPGACLGEMALLDGGARSATAIAARPSTLLRVSQESLERLFRTRPEARTKYLRDGVRILSERLRSSNRRYWDLADRSVRAQMEASESRARLLSLVSHELRTPLTAIKISAQLIARGAGGREGEFAGKIVRETDRLRVLTEDLIALCLLQSGLGGAGESEVDLPELVTELIAEIRGRADGASASIVEELGEATVVADRGLLRRALDHVVENAVKFSPPGATVRVEVDRDASGAVHVRVIDRGPGLDPRALERLRLSFVQEQDPLNRDVEGLGIGLPLAHEVLAAMGGRLSVESSPGEGTRVSLVLPASPGQSPQEAAEVGKRTHGSDAVNARAR